MTNMISAAHCRCTIWKWLVPAVILIAAAMVAGDTKAWKKDQLATFSNDFLKSVNELRRKLNTKELKLDPDTSAKGLSGLARMYAAVWRGGPAPLPPNPELSVMKVFCEESKRATEEVEKLLRGALLYFDRNPVHLTGSNLVNLAAMAQPISDRVIADFSNDGDDTSDGSYTCNTVRKLLWTPAETIGVYADWNEQQAKQSYVIIFDDPHVQKGSLRKLSVEAIAYLGKLDCIHLAVDGDDVFANPAVEAIRKEAFEDEEKVKGTWTNPQATTFRNEVVRGINALREYLGGKALKLDDDLTKAAEIYATDYAKRQAVLDFKPTGMPWVASIAKETKFKDLEVLKTMRHSAILLNHVATPGGAHLKPGFFVRLLNGADSLSPLLGSIQHRFSNEGIDTTDRDGNLQTYCHRLKRLLWVPSEKIGIGMALHANSLTMYYVIFFDPARKKFEKERGKLTPKAVGYLLAKGNECRMDGVADETDLYLEDAASEIKQLRTTFGVPGTLTTKPELTKQAKEFAKDWAHSEVPLDTSRLAKGFVLYAKRRVPRTSDKIRDTANHWDANGVIESYELQQPKQFLKHLLDADRFGLPLPVTKQAPGPVSLTAETPTPARLNQLVCEEATEFGFAVSTYVYNTTPNSPDATQYFVLLFNAQCGNLPAIADQGVVAKLKAAGWINEKWSWYNGNVNKQR